MTCAGSAMATAGSTRARCRRCACRLVQLRGEPRDPGGLPDHLPSCAGVTMRAIDHGPDRQRRAAGGFVHGCCRGARRSWPRWPSWSRSWRGARCPGSMRSPSGAALPGREIHPARPLPDRGLLTIWAARTRAHLPHSGFSRFRRDPGVRPQHLARALGSHLDHGLAPRPPGRPGAHRARSRPSTPAGASCR